mmetsp:Transcript_24092/g.36138  ORF Transcript_24092/g.36138 Transcript_24092/m.36138 type:complete len:445 (+) Transcript_24092:18-1352(+)
MAEFEAAKHQWSLPSRPGLQISEDEGDAPFQAMPLLSVAEAEQHIEMLRSFPLEEVGTSDWLKQSEIIGKLNIQAHQSAAQRSDEFVLEALQTWEKVPLLVEELLRVEAWRTHALPALRALGVGRAMRLYFVLYHEAALTNLLEVVLYHGHVLAGVPEAALLELVDYCARRLRRLNARLPFEAAQPALTDPRELAAALDARTPGEELAGYAGETDFKVCVTAVSLMRYLCEHISQLPLAIMTRILDTHDILLSLIPLIENPPWTRRLDSGKWEKFVELKWRTVEPVDLLTLTKTEAQVWLAVYHLMCNGDCRRRYAFNGFRKDQVLRVRKYLNDFMLDQLPVLADVQRYMDELALMEVPEAAQQPSALLLEQMPELRLGIVKNVDWEALARRQKEEIFDRYTDANDPDLRRFAEMYSDDAVEAILEPLPATDGDKGNNLEALDP